MPWQCLYKWWGKRLTPVSSLWYYSNERLLPALETCTCTQNPTSLGWLPSLCDEIKYVCSISSNFNLNPLRTHEEAYLLGKYSLWVHPKYTKPSAEYKLRIQDSVCEQILNFSDLGWPLDQRSLALIGFQAVGFGFRFKKIQMDLDSWGFRFETGGFKVPGFTPHWLIQVVFQAAVYPYLTSDAIQDSLRSASSCGILLNNSFPSAA